MDNQKITCIIVDDEPLAQEVIEALLAKHADFEILKKCNNAKEASDFLKKNVVDCMFLDINMPEMTGLEFLRSLDTAPLAIFTTAYDNHAIEGFELDALDYLLKPISEERFDKTISRIQETMKSIRNPEESLAAKIGKQYMFVKADYKIVKVNYDDVLYIEGLKDYVKIHLTSGKRIVTLQTMKYLEENLPKSIFTRVHRSFIIAFDKIETIVGNSIEIDGKLIPIGKSFKDELFKIVDEFNISK